ncbi:MAG: DUF3293 domain-containing protein [Stackebrandtia sp.]
MREQGNDLIRRCARRYAENIGLKHDTPDFTPPTEQKGMLIADLFEAMAHEPDDPVVRSSYRQYIREIADQFECVVDDLGIHIEAWTGSGEPYRDSGHMMDDVRRDRHLYFLPTRSRWGEDDVCHDDNPTAAPTGVSVDGYELLANDMFRVVHDVFAHAKEGYKFGPVGEEKAWLEHLGMFSPLARPALTSETRGQTCWTFYGPHLRHASGSLVRKGEPEWTPVSRRRFAEQKAGLLPAEVSGVRLRLDARDGGVDAEPLPDWDTDTCLVLDRVRRTPSAATPDGLAEAYRHTTYRATAPHGTIDIRVGARCHALDDLLVRRRMRAWGFLTAWNPGSRELSLSENRRRNLMLEDRLRDLGALTLPSLGIGDDQTWTPEESVLALGLDPEASVRIGREFQQNAVVAGRLGEAPELLWCAG